MFIAHGPAGYISARFLYSRFEPDGIAFRHFAWAGILGNLAPDLDLLRYCLIDYHYYHHHTYWTHFPLVWLALLGMAYLWFRWARDRRGPALAIIFSLNGLLHMVLDSLAGGIWWLAPFVNKSFGLFTVPAVYQPWWLNFIFHWTFGVELLIVAWGLWLWRRDTSGARLAWN